MSIPKRENELKTAFWKRFKQIYPLSMYFVMQHQDVRKAGYPDSSVHGFKKSTFWEFKHCTPNFTSHEIQEITCARLDRHTCACRYVLWVESADTCRTVIASPYDVLSKHGHIADIDPLFSFNGLSFDALAEYIHGVHTEFK